VKRKPSVLIDSSQPLFSDRLIHQLSSSGLKVENLSIPQEKRSLLSWICRLKKSEARIVHYIGGFHGAHLYIAPKLVCKRVVIHWIGSDVLLITSDKIPLIQRMLKKTAWRITDLHLAVSSPLADELRALGIKATVIPLVPDTFPTEVENITWPSANRVYVYLPEGRQEFYGSDTVFRLANEMADTEFLITGYSGENAPQLPNLKYLGWVDNMEGVWKKVKVHLRLTEHDGLPHTLIEALTRGKYVVWSNEFPHCLQARSFEEAREALKISLRQNQPNVAGMAYARREFNPLKVAQNLKEEYRKLIIKC